jgi:arylsulfatase A-like enzyme
VQGESLRPALDGEPDSGRPAVFTETHNVKTIRTREWKLIFYGRHPERGHLFRMGAQPDELTNEWDNPAHAAVKLDLLGQLMAWTVRCEQPHTMDWKAEAFVDTRWYQWLKTRPHQCESESDWRNRV